MRYRIEISEVAEIEAEAAYLWLSRQSPERAARWYEGFLAAIEALAEFPNRCAYARENHLFDRNIRQLLYGQGRTVYRVLFMVVEPSSAGEEGIVRILHVRHAARPDLGTREPSESPEDS